MDILNTILDIVFPRKCLACGKNGFDLCLDCISLIPSAERESAKWIFPLYDYRDPHIKKTIWLFKYSGKKRLAQIFALPLYEMMTEEISELQIMQNFLNPVLIPIPLSRTRKRERGYNQAEILCEEIMKINRLRKNLSLELQNKILVKTKDSPHQARIKNRTARLKNIVGSFEVENTELIKNRNIILVDDILTTGATLSEARKVLKNAGARKIIAFTVAH